MISGKSVATVLLAAALVASAGCQSAPTSDVYEPSTIVHTDPAVAQVRGEPGALCPLRRVVTPKGAFASALMACGPDPSLPLSIQEWFITNNSDGVLRVTPRSPGQGLQAAAPPPDDTDPVPSAAARVVPAGPDKTGSVLVPAHGNVRITGGYPVDVRIDSAYSAESILTASILKVGLNVFGGQFINTLTNLKPCTAGTSGILAKYASSGRDGANFFAAAQSDYVHASPCVVVFGTMQAGSNRIAAAELEDTIFQDIATQSWRPLAKLISEGSLTIIPKTSS